MALNGRLETSNVANIMRYGSKNKVGTSKYVSWCAVKCANIIIVNGI